MLLEEWIPAFAGMTDMIMGLSSTLFGDDPKLFICGRALTRSPFANSANLSANGRIFWFDHSTALFYNFF